MALAVSKIIYVSYLTTVPPDVISSLHDIHKKFVWEGKNPRSNTVLLLITTIREVLKILILSQNSKRLIYPGWKVITVTTLIHGC